MNRPTPALHRHLLTRADLAELAVPAPEVFRWLASARIEVVGSLPRPRHGDDPVLCVTDASLREQLQRSLSEHGRDTVVMTPVGVRSFLLRAMILADESSGRIDHGGGAQQAAHEAGPAASRLSDGLENDLTVDDLFLSEALRSAAIGIGDDVDAILRLAAEIVAKEALSVPNFESAALADPAREQTSEVAKEPNEAETPGAMDHDHESLDDQACDPIEDEDCFDFDDLAEQLDTWQAPDSDEHGSTSIHDRCESDLADPVIDHDTIGAADNDVVGSSESTRRGDYMDTTQPDEAIVPDAPSFERSPSSRAPAPGDLVDPIPDRLQVEDEGGQRVDEVAFEDLLATTEVTITSSQDSELSAEGPATPTMEHEGRATEEARSIPDDPAGAVSGQISAGDSSPPMAALELHDDPEVMTEGSTNAGVADDTGEGLTSATVAPEPIDTPRDDEPSSRPTPSSAAESNTQGDEFALTSAAMDRVQDFLGELRNALVEMARPPVSPTIDMSPLVTALQAGLDRSSEQAQQTQTALQSLTEQLGHFGERVEGGVVRSMAAIAEQMPRGGGAVASPMFVPPAGFVGRSNAAQGLVLVAVAILVVCWAVLFWFKTGSPRLALATLIGANAVGCTILMARRANG